MIDYNQKNIIESKLLNSIVLAGAGSGKTKVLIARLFYLIKKHSINSKKIIVITFTNKAKKEILERIGNKIKKEFYPLIGTFHSISFFFIKNHYLLCGLQKGFNIIDSYEQKRIFNNILIKNNFQKDFNSKNIQKIINNYKNNKIRSYNIIVNNDFDKKIKNIYEKYEIVCKQNNVIDFAEILLKVIELFDKNEKIQKYYSQYYSQILVDEFQDTNNIQYNFLKKIHGNYGNIMFVGDDDQSIYGWRGALSNNYKNIINDYSNIKIFTLEKNYRSTNNILSVANSIINSKDKNRIPKKLWSNNDNGEKIDIIENESDIQEAEKIASIINNLIKKKNILLSNIVIMYRANMQSTIIEKNLLKYNITYTIFRKRKILDKKEIKIILCYIKFIKNSHDFIAFKEIILFFPNGIGNKTLQEIDLIKKERNIDIMQIIILLHKKYTNKKKQNMLLLLNNLVDIKKFLYNNKKTLLEKINFIIKITDLLNILKDKKNFLSHDKENIDDFLKFVKEFEEENDNHKYNIDYFIDSFILNENTENNNIDSVKLMTFHASKGLEFDIVFITGMENGIFPHNNSNILEEFRLCYVAITRAKKKLFLTYSKKRFTNGKYFFQKRSQFLDIIIEKNIDIINTNNKLIVKNNTFKEKLLKYQIIKHKVFGIGKILNIKYENNKKKILIDFDNYGIKNILFKKQYFID